MFNFIKRLFSHRQHIPTGAVADTRTELQKEGAYDARELTTSSQVEWTPKTVWRSYPIKRQWYTGECVAQSTTKHLGINHDKETGSYVDLLAGFFYWFRVNKPTAGMIWLDAMKLATTTGACLGIRGTQRMRDSDPEIVPTTGMINEALAYRGKAFIEDKERTIDSVARIIQSQGSCLVWFYFDTNGAEWWKVEPKTIYNFSSPYASGTTRHAVTATDFGIRNGKQVIKIEDSAGNSSAENEQDRFIDAEFMKRCFVAGYVVDLPNEIPTPNKPKWTGTRDLKVGIRGADVKTLQEILMIEKCFDFDTATGYFGGISKAGVIKLQDKYANEILRPVGLTKGTGYCGKSTRDWLDKNYK